MTLRILIADDEPLARERLREMVSELGHDVCAVAADAQTAAGILEQKQPDVALLDIQMPGQDGLSLAQRIAEEHPRTRVILVTAYPNYALAAFDAAVRDYVLKPVRKERLAEALERVGRDPHLEEPSSNPQIRITIGRREQLIALDQIDCFVAEQGYVLARSAELEGFVDARLNELEQRFCEELLRVHRSCLAVRASIAGIERRSDNDHRLIFRDGLLPVPISRRHLAATRTFLHKSAGNNT